jgi:anti-sigma28 factor (negative regulator of flagellin synthesis)
MAGISEKRVKVIVRTSRKSRKIGQHRITKTTQNQLSPNQRSQMTKMRPQNVPVHRQRVLALADAIEDGGLETALQERRNEAN